MIESGVLITALIGIVTTFTSGFTAWFFARKKYNSEVDNNLINNMKESLDFYKKLSDDNRERLDEVLKRNDNLEEEVKELRQQVMSLMTSICTDLSCQIRKGNYEELLNKEST
jgi:hypothetical protein